MRPDGPRSRRLVELIIPIVAGLAVWAWSGLLEGVLVAATASLLVLSHIARSRARDQLIYQPATDHAGHAAGGRDVDK